MRASEILMIIGGMNVLCTAVLLILLVVGELWDRWW